MTIMDNKKFYEEKWKEEIDRVIGQDYDQYKNKYIGTPKITLIEKWFQYLPEKPVTICEVGCGSGRVLSYFKEKFNIEQAIGFDISDRSISFAKKHHPDCNFEVLDIDQQQIPFEDDAIDVVILCDIIEHVFDYKTLFAEAMRVGKNVLVKIPLERNLMTMIATLLKKPTVFSKRHPHGHIHAFSRKAFLAFLHSEFADWKIDFEQQGDHSNSNYKIVKLIDKILKTTFLYEYVLTTNLGIWLHK